MKAHSLQAVGSILVPRYPTLPTWTSADEGRLIYVEDDDKVYYGSSSQWTEGTGTGGGSSSGSGVDYIEIKSMLIDNMSDGVSGGNVFNLLPCFDFDSNLFGSLLFDFDLPDNWGLNTDIVFDLYYVLDGEDPVKNVRVKTEVWVVNNSDTESEGFPNVTEYDLIVSSSSNQGKFYKATLTNGKLSKSYLTSLNSTITVRISRDATDTLDTYNGIFKLVKVVARLSGTEAVSSNLGNQNDITVYNKVADYIIQPEEANSFFTNYNITGPIQFTLPPAVKNKRCEFMKCQLHRFAVKADGTDQLDNTIGGFLIEDSTNNVGLLLCAIENGKWVSICRTGNWNSCDRGIIGGGSSINIIDYVTISSLGNAIDFGDLVSSRSVNAVSNGSNNRALFISNVYSTNVIDSILILTLGNSVDFGDRLYLRGSCASVSNGLIDRCVTAGGFTASNASTVMEYCSISSPNNGIDFGDISSARYGLFGISNSVNDRGVFGAGWNGYISTYYNIIEYITISIISNSADFGDAISNIRFVTGLSNGINNRGIYAGGGVNSVYNDIRYLTISTLGNSINFGDLIQAKWSLCGTSNAINDRGIFATGNTSFSGTSNVNVIEYITISILGNAIDFGDLTTSRSDSGATSNA